MITEADIQKMTDIIVEQFHPEKIILFGSYAKGTATEDSDVDLIVVTRDSEINIRDQIAKIQVAVWDIPVAKDILVSTESQFEHQRCISWTVFKDAVDTGRVLYEHM